MNNETIFSLKGAAVAVAGWLWAALCPALPFTLVCTLMVLADVVSARRLARRLGRRKPSHRQKLKFSSAKFGRTLSKLMRIYALLLITALLQHTVAGQEVNLLRIVAATICLWQGVSILENESTACDRPWARLLSKVLVDKTARHLGMEPDELRHELFDVENKDDQTPHRLD